LELLDTLVRPWQEWSAGSRGFGWSHTSLMGLASRHCESWTWGSKLASRLGKKWPQL